MTKTIQIAEIIWMVTAIPGLVVWLINLRESLKTMRIAKLQSRTDPRYVWARFSTFLTVAAVLVEASFILIGSASMTVPASPSGNVVVRYVVTTFFVLVSIVITIIGLEWKRVHSNIMDIVRRQRGL